MTSALFLHCRGGGTEAFTISSGRQQIESRFKKHGRVSKDAAWQKPEQKLQILKFTWSLYWSEPLRVL